MVSESAPAVVEQRALVSVALHIGEVAVVDPPCVMKPGELCVIYMLLPVKPPEVDAFLLHRMHHLLEHVGHEHLVRVDPVDALCTFRILAETFGQGRVALLPVVESVSRMQVESDLKAFAFEIFHELLRVREETLVPCPSCPSAASFVCVMPVHVYNEHVKRNVICMELVHQRTHFLVGVCPVA